MTDLALIDLSPWLARSNLDHERILRAINQALKLAGARLLELDGRELGTLHEVAWGPKGTGLAAAVMDAMSGGAGHVQDLLLNRPRQWLEAARDQLFVSPEHHVQCESGCIDCILTFDAYESSGLLGFDRRGAWRLLDDLLSGRQPPPAKPPVPESAPKDPGPAPHCAGDKAARARDKMSKVAWVKAKREAATVVQNLLKRYQNAGVPCPKVGFELTNDRGFVIAFAELAWQEHKMAVLIEEDPMVEKAFAMAGWRVARAGDDHAISPEWLDALRSPA